MDLISSLRYAAQKKKEEEEAAARKAAAEAEDTPAEDSDEAGSPAPGDAPATDS
jgi:hypothetical protein